jgi:hypothetical protein
LSDHAPTTHDDVANAVAGVVDMLTAGNSGYDSSMRWVSGRIPSEPCNSARKVEGRRVFHFTTRRPSHFSALLFHGQTFRWDSQFFWKFFPGFFSLRQPGRVRVGGPGKGTGGATYRFAGMAEAPAVPARSATSMTRSSKLAAAAALVASLNGSGSEPFPVGYERSLDLGGRPQRVANENRLKSRAP